MVGIVYINYYWDQSILYKKNGNSDIRFQISMLIKGMLCHKSFHISVIKLDNLLSRT